MENKSGLKPLGRAVLVQAYEPEKVNSLIQLPPSVMDRQMAIEQRVIVVEIGLACWPDEPPRAKPGDKVIIARMAGYNVVGTLDGQNYRAVNDRDIFMQITGEIENGTN